MFTFVCFYLFVCLVAEIQEAHTDFNDLGKLLLGGVAAAIVFALAFTFVRLRLRDNQPPTSSFLSISAPAEKNEKGPS